MKPEPKSTPGGRLLLAFEMADLGIALMRANLRKRFPADSDEELHRRMADWLAGPDPTGVHLRSRPWPR